jgi:hypothetical protein
MPHSYTRFNLGIGSLAALGVAIHNALLTAGWTIEFANGDAIGTGSASNPAWTKTPANAASGGVVIYRMPISGAFTRWYVRFELFWNAVASPNFVSMSLQTGLGVNAGALVSPGSLTGCINPSGSVSNFSNDAFVIANENLFLVALAGNAATSTTIYGCERARDVNQIVQDDIASYQLMGGSLSLTPGFTSDSCLRRSALEGQRIASPLIYTTPLTSPISTITTLNIPDGTKGYPLGPQISSGGLGGTLRGFHLWHTNDTIPNAVVGVLIDGAAKNYFWSGSFSTLSNVRFAFPQQ